MAENNLDDEKREIKLEKLVQIILIIGIAIMTPVIIGLSIKQESPYIIFGLLNENKEMGNYPKSAPINETITLYVFVKPYNFNHLDIKIKHLTGNSSTIVSDNSSAINFTAEIKEVNASLNDSVEWVSGPMNTTFYTPQNNAKIIFELWTNSSDGYQFYDSVFINLNITSNTTTDDSGCDTNDKAQGNHHF
ncbi:MAG: hypothetical protein ACTSU2_17450 [Promethearchaeota archaeon]